MQAHCLESPGRVAAMSRWGSGLFFSVLFPFFAWPPVVVVKKWVPTNRKNIALVEAPCCF